MNKYQEALNTLINGFKKRFPAIKVSTETEMYATLQELVDKETPMKAIPVKNGWDVLYKYTCPKCNGKIEGSGHYCNKCGQKLRVGE